MRSPCPINRGNIWTPSSRGAFSDIWRRLAACWRRGRGAFAARGGARRHLDVTRCERAARAPPGRRQAPLSVAERRQAPPRGAWRRDFSLAARRNATRRSRGAPVKAPREATSTETRVREDSPITLPTHQGSSHAVVQGGLPAVVTRSCSLPRAARPAHSLSLLLRPDTRNPSASQTGCCCWPARPAAPSSHPASGSSHRRGSSLHRAPRRHVSVWRQRPSRWS